MIDSFSRQYRFLSNFYPALVFYDGNLYPSSENAYQAAKVPQELRHLFLEITASEAKRLGRKLKCRDDWDQVKVQIMRSIIQSKFQAGSVLGTRLVETYPEELIEGNTWGDTFWGVCNGVGQNQLGYLLMEQRDSLR